MTGFFVVQVSCASGSVAGSQLFVTAETISQSGPRCGPRFGQTHNGLARLINDDLISRDFPGAFTRRTRITFIARPYSDAGGAFLHLHHGHPYKHSPFGLEGMCCFAQIAHLISVTRLPPHPPRDGNERLSSLLRIWVSFGADMSAGGGPFLARLGLLQPEGQIGQFQEP